LSKIILPFYGNISEKQFSAINKKVQKKKPENISRDDFLLGKFETRLDIVVYRLNLAPNIF
jgi:ribosomal protein S4